MVCSEISFEPHETKNKEKEIKHKEENKNSTAFEGEKGVWFKIQVMASKEKLPLNSENFKGVVDVQEYYERGLYKYTVSKSSSFDQANNVLLPALKKKGFTQAFVVAFKDGKRIPVQEAIKIQNK